MSYHDKTYRVAILGCRGRGTAAGRAYHAHPRTEVVAVCDLIRERRDNLGDELGVAPDARYDDLDRMIEETNPDIVAIPVATELHYPLGMRVLKHGVHIDIEKPICPYLDQADELISQGPRVAVHHQGRVGGAMRTVAKAIEEGKIGRLRHIWCSGKGYYGGYGLMNIGTHLINNMLKFGIRCRSVIATAVTKGRRITPEDVLVAPNGMGVIAGEHITASILFEGGLTATLLHHRFHRVDNTAYAMEFLGTEGRLFWKSDGVWFLPQPHYVPDSEHDRWEFLAPFVPPEYDPNDKAALDDYLYADEYVRALDEDRDHECSGKEGVHVLEIMMGIFESAAYGRRIDLPQTDRSHPLLRWRHENGLGDPIPKPRDYSAWLAEEDRR